MGAICTDCNSYQEELSTHIIVSKQFFVPTETNPEMLQQIKCLSDNQLPQDLVSGNFYRKGQDTFYIGSIQDEIKQTQGILYKPKKTLYFGQFLNGLFHGKGVLKLLNNNITYHGEFKQGHPFGNGKVSNCIGTFLFEGKWEDHAHPSSGILKFYSDNTFNQIKFIDCESGNVQIIYKNDSFYKGFVEKKTLLPHGMGNMTYNSGDLYDGEWVNGKFHGSGSYTFKDGRIYNGEYSQGMKHGEGTLYLTDNRYFSGMWKQGRRDGFGKLMEKGGKIIQKGIYRNNKFNYEETQIYLNNYMQKAVRQQLRSQLMDGEQRDDLSIQNKIPS